MAIKAECPRCHRKQKVSNKLCKCGQSMDRAKKDGKVRFHITYRLNGKQKQESVGYSLKEANDADSKRAVQKRENNIFEITPDAEMTMQELTDWYLDTPSVKKLKSYRTLGIRLNNFNKVYGGRTVNTIKPIDLEAYQDTREADGLAPVTIDVELTCIKGVIIKAFDNDLVSGRTLKAFKNWKRKAKPDDRVRTRVLTLEEYLALEAACLMDHLRSALILAMHTGMRSGEIRQLHWDHIDLQNGFMRLPKDIVKEKRDKVIPINHHVHTLLRGLGTRFAGGPVLTYAGRPLGDSKKGVEAACKRAEIIYGKNVEKGFIFHDLRRTFKSNMATAEVAKEIRDKIVGHSLTGMDKHYLTVSEERLREGMERYTAWFDSQIATVDHSVDHENATS
jgi:integrase